MPIARPPYAMLTAYTRPGLKCPEYRIFYNSGMVQAYGLKRGEYITYKWLEEEAAVVITRVPVGTPGGHKLGICYKKRPESSALYSTASYFVKRYEVPRHVHPLPILDVIDNEIWLDFSGEVAATDYGLAGMHGKHSREVMCSLKERSRRSARLLADIGDMNFVSRTFPELSDLGKRVARVEKQSFSAFVENAVAYYIEKEYPDLWETLQRRQKS